MLVVAHRLTTIAGADRIVVLGHDGRIEAQGGHAALLATSPTYARLWADYGASVAWTPSAGALRDDRSGSGTVSPARRSLVPAAALAASGALLAAVPTAIVAFVLYRASNRATRTADLVAAALILALALGLRFALASAAGRRVRRALNEFAERVRVDVLEGLQRLPARRVRETRCRPGGRDA